MRRRRTNWPGFMRGKTSRVDHTDISVLADHTLPDSRKTCGKRSRRRWRYPGERPRPCTGRSAKSRWPNAPTCPSSTSPATTPRMVPLRLHRRSTDLAPLRAPSRVVQSCQAPTLIRLIATHCHSFRHHRWHQTRYASRLSAGREGPWMSRFRRCLGTEPIVLGRWRRRRLRSCGRQRFHRWAKS